ncbi:MAG TPA: hypothetical protein VKY80_09960 [Croceibacterium sp.]|nr:hypothetical protein [Croceibacterium sp.]
MKKLAIIMAGAAVALTGATAASAQTVAERGEAKLAQMLEGRVAGEPVKCISAPRGNRVQVIENVGIVYDAGKTIYVARAVDPKMLDHWDVPIIDRFGSQLCTNDVMRTVDRSSGHFTGAVFLDDFVPYTKNG